MADITFCPEAICLAEKSMPHKEACGKAWLIAIN